ncbi:MAG: Ig-like domain-containing protein, partial [Calditrichia bacterium]
MAVISLLTVLSIKCAHKAAPTGGPPDETPPEVVRTFPNTDSVGVSRIDYIEIEFSEAISKTTLLNNYWLVPRPEEPLEISWKGSKKVRLYFPNQLADNRTYVLTLGTGISDMRNNKLARPLQLAFSTGMALDSGRVSGRVMSDQEVREVFVYAYELTDSLSDSLFLNSQPPFFTQLNKEGGYRLNYLPMGTYRLIALNDLDYNKIYDAGTDRIGIPFTDIQLDSAQPAFYNLNFYLIQEDTLPPRLQAVDTLSRREISLTFNEPVQLPDTPFVQILDTVAGIAYKPLAVSRPAGTSDQLAVFLPEIPARQSLVVQVTGASDSLGNVPPQNMLQRKFISPARRDTMPPALVGISAAPSGPRIPYNANFFISFNTPVDTGKFRAAFHLRNEAGQPVYGHFTFSDLRRPMFTPDSLLRPDNLYRAELNLDTLQDLFGRSFTDTLIISEFETMSSADLGEIAGNTSASVPQWKNVLIYAK